MLGRTAFNFLIASLFHYLGNDIMRIDIYRRAEHDGKFSYLAVPESKAIPEEATNTDWEMNQRAFEVQDGANHLPDFHIEHLSEQIAEKGYAVTALADQ
jgi:hypothetical protein